MDDFKILGTLVQGGSFGLLCFIVWWLTRWVPKRIERADAVRETEASSRESVALTLKEAITIQADGYLAANRDALRAFEEQQKYERATCERRHDELRQIYEKRHDETRQTYERRHEEVLTLMTKQYDLTREVRSEIASIAYARAMDRAASEAATQEHRKSKSQQASTKDKILVAASTVQVNE